ncbi:TrkA family potassium uptake protein [Halostella sp. JP-L12]|uniref:potassium channel family protein n=1 Tax=Halostella TaxID=1843185 RepID=UPI000EF853D9|nr:MULTISPECIES: NAD-binding protein [Halostella]NHN48889.1 TrkA family potassium uptake protein [Halostella sp. JP-L12]
MSKWRRRTALYLLSLAAVMATYAVAYHVGMAVFEGRPSSFFHSVQVVVETFTTTGFGSDAPWSSPWMNLLVVLMDLTGVFLIFLALPVFVFPLFEEALATSAPRAAEDTADHVVVCEYTPHGEALVEELETSDQEYVVVESDEEVAAELYEDDLSVIHGDPESTETLRRANADAATAVVADADDERNASIVLSAREVSPNARVVTLLEDRANEPYHRLAGADTVLSPERILGGSLADKITGSIDAPDVVGDDFEIAELTVQRDSAVAGQRLKESGIREGTGVNVVGIWERGEFRSPPSPDTVLSGGTVLLAAGRVRSLEALRRLTRSKKRRPARSNVVVLGRGEVGSTVVDELAAADVDATVVDLREMPAVDVVGDATERSTLREAGVPDATTVVLALGSDTATTFATLVVDELNPDAEIVCRAAEGESVPKLYRAGADYVLALSRVSGRMLASTVLDEDIISLDTQVEVVRAPVPALAGSTLRSANVRERTGCTVVAVEREGEMITDLGPEFRFRAGDEAIVAGRDADVNEFTALTSGDD